MSESITVKRMETYKGQSVAKMTHEDGSVEFAVPPITRGLASIEAAKAFIDRHGRDYPDYDGYVIQTRTRHGGLGGTVTCKHCGEAWPSFGFPTECKKRSTPGQAVYCEPYKGGPMERAGE